MRRILGLSGALALSAVACDASVPPAGPRVEGVAPDPVVPGATLTVRGHGFGESAGARDGAALGGRPLRPLSWSTARLAFEVPPDVPAGAAFLRLHAAGRPLAPVPVTVAGEGRFPRWPAVPPGFGADAGPAPVDAAPGPLGDVPVLPDATLTGAIATFAPDDAAPTGTALVALEGPPGELTLEVRSSPGLWAQAFHLTYDPNLLQFVSASPAPTLEAPALHWALTGPGRLLFGGLDRGPGVSALRVRFAAVGAGEGRIDLPARTASARAPGNRPIADWPFVGGSVRVEVRP